MSALEPTGLSDDVRLLVWDLSRRFRMESEGTTDLPLAQQAVLSRLDGHEGLTSADLARRERVSPQSMSVTVASLRSAGLVDAVPSPDDGRRRLLALTPAGADELARIRATRSSWLARRLDGLTDAERGTVRDAVGLLRRVIEQDPGDHGSVRS